MNIFNTFETQLSYEDILQLDGAFSVAHINYGEAPLFNGNSSKDITNISRMNSVSSFDRIENVVESIRSFDGTEKNFNVKDRILLWKLYWIEYINAFDKLSEILPKSITTINVGRQAIEIGLKYLLLMKTHRVNKTHDLGVLALLLFSEYEINEEYMKGIDTFCELYCKYIEGGNSEYFRYPEYKSNSYFAGNRLDISWLSYNFTIILLKLIHFADLENELYWQEG